jgi:hypothetical protein
MQAWNNYHRQEGTSYNGALLKMYSRAQYTNTHVYLVSFANQDHLFRPGVFEPLVIVCVSLQFSRNTVRKPEGSQPMAECLYNSHDSFLHRCQVH